MSDDENFRFAPDGEGTVNLASDERLALLAVCVAHQQKAGFRAYLDLRQASCPDCGAPGFNTGWGAWMHTCGSEWNGDGEQFEPCSHAKPEPTDD
jgi:hypothetical protein